MPIARDKASRYAIVVGVALVACAIAIVMIPARAWLLIRIYSTRTLTAHWSIGYDQRSVVAMSKRLGPRDVPGLIALLVESDKPLDATLALESQCSAAVDGISRALDVGEIGQGKGVRQDLGRALEVASGIHGSALCDGDTRARADELGAKLRIFASHVGAEAAEERRERDDEHARAVRRGLEDVRAYGAGKLPSLPRPVSSARTSPRQQP